MWISFENNTLRFYLPDGFWVTPHHEVNSSEKTVRTDDSVVDFSIEDIDDIKYNINEDLSYDKTLPWLRTNPTNESLLYKEYIKKYDRYNRSDSW